MPLLEVRDVAVRFGGIVALDGVSFEVAAGSIVGLIGPNGAGKTTLFNCLSRLYPCDRGEIVFDGTLAARDAAPPHRRDGHRAHVPEPGAVRPMTVLENVMVGAPLPQRAAAFSPMRCACRACGARKRAIADKAAAILQLPRSGARSRRVPVRSCRSARRSAWSWRARSPREPKLLLLDEPASGLNHEEVGELGGLIRGIRDGCALTVLLVEHHMSLVMSISDRVVALNFGRKIAEGTPGGGAAPSRGRCGPIWGAA